MNQGLHIDDLCRRYGPRWALKHVSFQVGPGVGCMLTGHNGSGKSTLLKCVATALRAHRGAVTFDGREIWTDRRTVRRQIAYLGHEHHVYEDLSAAQNLALWGRLGGYSPDIPALLARVCLETDRDDPLRTFSAGMRRRLALARMLLKSPKLVLLDEPFSALDPAGRTLMIDIANELIQGGATLLLATHMPLEARRCCERTINLDAGKTTFDGPADTFLESVPS